jgi:hypothetical protein
VAAARPQRDIALAALSSVAGLVCAGWRGRSDACQLGTSRAKGLNSARSYSVRRHTTQGQEFGPETAVFCANADQLQREMKRWGQEAHQLHTRLSRKSHAFWRLLDRNPACDDRSSRPAREIGALSSPWSSLEPPVTPHRTPQRHQTSEGALLAPRRKATGNLQRPVGKSNHPTAFRAACPIERWSKSLRV